LRLTRFLLLSHLRPALPSPDASADTTLASSTFDLTSEGLTVGNNGGSVTPDYHSAGGNPGGFISDLRPRRIL